MKGIHLSEFLFFFFLFCPPLQTASDRSIMLAIWLISVFSVKIWQTFIDPSFPPDAYAAHNVIDAFYSQSQQVGAFKTLIGCERVPPSWSQEIVKS